MALEQLGQKIPEAPLATLAPTTPLTSSSEVVIRGTRTRTGQDHRHITDGGSDEGRSRTLSGGTCS